MFAKSIRWRLQLWLAFLLVCVLSGFCVTVYQLQRNNHLAQIDEELQTRVAALSGALRRPPPFGPRPGRPPGDEGVFGPMPRGGPGSPDPEGGPGRPPPPRGLEFPRPGGRQEMRFGLRDFGLREIRLSAEVAGLFDETRTNGFYFAVWGFDGAALKRSTNAPAELQIPERFANDTRTHTQMRKTCREAFHFTEMGDCVLAGRSIAADLNTLHRFKLLLLAAGGAVLALGLGGGWLLASRALRPVEDISATASRISAGHLSERISVADTDNELGRLAGVLNSTFARLEAAFAQQKQFTADASHELRTPLTVIISEAQTTLARERSAPEYRETLEACLETAQQMRRLAESLLELARFDAGQEPMRHERFDLAATAEACVALVRPLAVRRHIEMRCDLSRVECLGDADRLGQVITNLLTNAIQYNSDRGFVQVSVQPQRDSAILSVSDNGPGIPEEALPHIFERFYRADQSRSGAAGRSGLGLAISKAIVEAHGGTIEVSSQTGAGTTFTVRLPVEPDPA